MKACCSTNTAALVTLAFLFNGFPLANADILDEYSCNSSGNERIISLRTQPTSNSMCDVFYQKADEGMPPQILWTANYDLNYCKGKFGQLIGSLSGSGWSCQPKTAEVPGLVEKPVGSPMPQEPPLTVDSASIPQVQQENEGGESDNTDLTWEEYSAFLAAQENLNETSTDSIGKIYKDYFDQCYEGIDKEDNQFHPFDLCNCMIGEFWRRGIDSATVYSLVHDAEVKEKNGCSSGVDDTLSLVCENLNVAEKFEVDLLEGCESYVGGQ